MTALLTGCPKYGIEYAFVVEFENDDDWRYYANEDPTHVSFKKEVDCLLEKTQRVDFTPGTFD